MSVDPNEHQREQNERIALRVVGACFLALATYVAIESFRDLLSRNASVVREILTFH